MKRVDLIVREVEKELQASKPHIETKNVGYVREVRDEVVIAEGLNESPYGEIVEFEGGATGMIVDLLEDNVGIIVFGDYTKIREGDVVKGSGSTFAIPVGDDFAGRIVNGVGSPIDGKGPVQTNKSAFFDPIAPGVLDRKSVSRPLQTGVKTIDALIPIGRGQRELIIGDRRTGKSTLAIDTILNQKDENVLCIYCSIGQRLSNVANIARTLETRGAMAYSIIVAATASDSASMQYVAPYVATAIGEYFMRKGRDVLVVYDDLTKHAWAYRQISLILRRPAGREAYPGDIFYLHSRLLERSCQLNDTLGGGSLTALPIIETQENDVSAYIPTNVISITDGQIFLESDLFNAGIRPAINVGASVSRVGSAAQTKAMKSVVKSLKNDLAQFRELAAFAQFESELDDSTKKFLDRGQRMTRLLKQGAHTPYTLAQQVVLFWFGSKGYLDTVPVEDIETYESRFIEFFITSHSVILKDIQTSRELTDTVESKLERAAQSFMNSQQ